MKKTKSRTAHIKKGATVLMVLCLALVLLAVFFLDRRDQMLVQPGPSLEENSPIQEDSPADQEGPQPVYLVGAVKEPGIYYVKPQTCLFQVVEKAGGLTDDAACEAINLAQIVQAHQLLRIPSQKDLASGQEQGVWDKEDEENSQLVDINQADTKRLESLPGIGPVTAQAIVDYRRQMGPFETLDELMLVPGIKQARFDALKDLIYLGPSSH